MNARLVLASGIVFVFLGSLGFGQYAPEPPVTIQEYYVGFPFDITAGPDGAMWFTNFSSIGRITSTGSITTFPLPTSNRYAGRITTGLDGALWFTEESSAADSTAIGRITTSGIITEYPLPIAASGIRGIAAGPDGSLWYTSWTGGRIGRMTMTGMVTEYPLPENASTDWITAGPDGALWFTEGTANMGKVGRITTEGIITEFPISRDAFAGITSGPDGALWVAGDSIVRITTSGAATAYDIPVCEASGICADGITAGPDGALWFTLFSANSIGRITTTGAFTQYAIPTVNSQSSGIASGPDGSIWFTEHASGKIGRIVFDEVDTTPPEIVPQITGTRGRNGWFRSNVTVAWSVTDQESGVASSSGCDPTTLSGDTPGVILDCSASNNAGLSNAVSVTIMIDRTPPVIVGLPGPGCRLWPPNHKLVPIATVTGRDETSGIVEKTFAVTGASNQASDSGEADIVIAPSGPGAYTVRLRAERLGNAADRVYSLRATVADVAGNRVTAKTICTVPHAR